MERDDLDQPDDQRGHDRDELVDAVRALLDGGADARYLARRIVRMASEDIGLADIRALPLCLDAAETYERLGSPEGELALAQAVVFLACAAKSNRVYSAYKAAMAYARDNGSAPVPMHLRTERPVRVTINVVFSLPLKHSIPRLR